MNEVEARKHAHRAHEYEAEKACVCSHENRIHRRGITSPGPRPCTFVEGESVCLCMDFLEDSLARLGQP